MTFSDFSKPMTPFERAEVIVPMSDDHLIELKKLCHDDIDKLNREISPLVSRRDDVYDTLHIVKLELHSRGLK